MSLEILWFCLVCALWSAYFLTEGFDFGVGMLLPVLGRDETDRKVMLRTIEPVWDGNEVWLLVGGVAIFGAFPDWYATMFSSFYLLFVLILVALIVRIVSFEWGNKSSNPRWRSFWLGANVLGSIGAPFVWGVAFANVVRGIPVDDEQNWAGSFGDLFNAYAVVGGVAVLLLFASHGAVFLRLRTTGELRGRAGALARGISVAAAAVGAAFLVWTIAVAVDSNDKGVFPTIVPVVLAAVFALAAVGLVFAGREGWSFAATGGTIVLAVITLFVALYPRVLVSNPVFENSLTIEGAAASHTALVTLTVIAFVLLPVVLVYQAWTYYVFRQRLGRSDFEARTPVDLLARNNRGTETDPGGG